MHIQTSAMKPDPVFKDVGPGEVFKSPGTGKFYMKVKSDGFDLAYDIVNGEPAHFASRDPVMLYLATVSLTQRESAYKRL